MGLFDIPIIRALIPSLEIKGKTMFFEKKVDTRSRVAMTAFLESHFKYDSSYANKVRFRNLGLNSAQMDAAYELMSADENFWEHLESLISDFTRANSGYQTIVSGGRSGGYLELRDSRYEPTGHKSRCRCCGQRNYKRVAAPLKEGSPEAIIAAEVARSQCSWIDTVYLEQSAVQAISMSDERKLEIIRKAKLDLKDATLGNKCGACGSEGERGRINFEKPPVSLSVSFGGTADDEEAMADWSIHDLRQRVKLVSEFDRACDSIRDEFISMLDNCEVIQEVVMIQKTVRRIGCRV